MCWRVILNVYCWATRPQNRVRRAALLWIFSLKTVLSERSTRDCCMQLNTIDELIEDLRQGKMIVLMDDEDRENEGDLIMIAELVRPEDINFMATHARGLICLPLTAEHCEQ